MLWINRFRIITAAIIIALAAAFIRFGPRPSVFEGAVSFVFGRAGRSAEHTLLPYGDKEKLKISARLDARTAAALQRENAELRSELRRLKFGGRLNVAPGGVIARVVSRDPDSWARTVTTDSGAASGVQPGFVATTDKGLAGIVISSGSGSSDVRLITDPGSAVSCIIERKAPAASDSPVTDSLKSSYFCVAYGNGTDKLDVAPIGPGAHAAAGDKVVTSGYGGNFPRGLPLGTITGLKGTGGYSYQSLQAAATAEFSDIEFLVLTPP